MADLDVKITEYTSFEKAVSFPSGEKAADLQQERLSEQVHHRDEGDKGRRSPAKRDETEIIRR